MIFKENSNEAPTDKFEKAGYEAERKVAFYLKMAFGENPDLLILNDLRVEFGDISAQMDHLIIYQHGIIIIESKSVAGKLQVQDDGQWIRWYAQSNAKDKSIGMPNPIKQAKIQGQTLMNVLSKAINENARSALNALPVDVLVAFSNHNGGVFIAKDKALYPEVCPADTVDDKVNEILAKRAKNPQNFSLSGTNRTKLAEHLVKIHKPYPKLLVTELHSKENIDFIDEKQHPKPEVVKPLKVEQKVSEYIVTDKPNPAILINATSKSVSSTSSVPESKFKHTCRKCKSEKLEISGGKYGYYFKCLNCDENTSNKAICSICKNLFKIRRDKKSFFAECSTCKTSELFHIND